MFSKLIFKKFPGFMVITVDRKTVSADLYNELWPKLLQRMLSIEFHDLNNQESVFSNDKIENLKIVISGKTASTSKITINQTVQSEVTEVSNLTMSFLVPGKEEIFSILEIKQGISYFKRRFNNPKLEEVKNIPEEYKELQKFFVKLLKESNVVIAQNSI